MVARSSGESSGSGGGSTGDWKVIGEAMTPEATTPRRVTSTTNSRMRFFMTDLHGGRAKPSPRRTRVLNEILFMFDACLAVDSIRITPLLRRVNWGLKKRILLFVVLVTLLG